MTQIIHTGVIVVGCVAGIFTVAIAWPSSRLREFIYFLANHRPRGPHQLN